MIARVSRQIRTAGSQYARSDGNETAARLRGLARARAIRVLRDKVVYLPVLGESRFKFRMDLLVLIIQKLLRRLRRPANLVALLWIGCVGRYLNSVQDKGFV